MRQLKFHCHQHVNDIGYLSLFQAASTPKASPRQMKWVAMVIQEQLPKDFLLYSRSSKLADSVFLNPHLFLYLWADAFKCLLNPVLCWTSSSWPPNQASTTEHWWNTTQHPCTTSEAITERIIILWQPFHPVVSEQTRARCTTSLRSSVSWNNYLSNDIISTTKKLATLIVWSRPLRCNSLFALEAGAQHLPELPVHSSSCQHFHTYTAQWRKHRACSAPLPSKDISKGVQNPLVLSNLTYHLLF